MPELNIDVPSWNSIFWFVGLTTIGFTALRLLERAQHKLLSLQATALVRDMIHDEFNKMLMDARKTKLLKELENYKPDDEKSE